MPPPKKEELWQLYLSLNAQEANQIIQPASALKQEEDTALANFQKKIEIDEELYPVEFSFKKFPFKFLPVE